MVESRGYRGARSSDTAVGGSPWNVDPEKAAVAQGRGIFRVWSRDVRPWYFRPADQYQLTESALAAVAEWDEFEDNPLLNCMAPGMPAVMGNPYPMEFVERDGAIELRFEEFDAVRVIHLAEGATEADVSASPLGYSVGHWEGDTLLITTSRINCPYFDRVGISQSAAVEVHERFRVVENGNGLEYEMTVTDPQTLSVRFRVVFLAPIARDDRGRLQNHHHAGHQDNDVYRNKQPVLGLVPLNQFQHRGPR